jgi:hypothetical protein
MWFAAFLSAVSTVGDLDPALALNLQYSEGMCQKFKPSDKCVTGLSVTEYHRWQYLFFFVAAAEIQNSPFHQ